MELFANQGYYTTSINQIAKKAGIAKGLLYNYFESKEELLTGIIERGLNDLAGSFNKNHDDVLTDDEFVVFINEMFQTLENNRTYWLLLFSLILQPAVHSIVLPKYRELVEQFIGILEKYYESKEVINPKISALAFGAFMDGIGLNYLLNPEMFPAEAIKEYITNTYIKVRNI